MRKSAICALAAFAVGATAHAQNFVVTQIAWQTVYERERLTDLTPGSESSVGYYLGSITPGMIVYDDALYFSATDGQTGPELWRFDGASVSQVADLYPGPNGSIPGFFAVFDGALYFTARTPSTGFELMRYDGANVTVAADIDQGLQSSTPRDKTVHRGRLYFVADDGPRGLELWRYDGTNATIVQDLNPGPKGAFETEFDAAIYKTRCCASFDGELFFFANRGDGAGMEPHVFNGNSIVRIANIAPGDQSSAYQGSVGPPFDAVELDDVLYFPAYNTQLGGKLWRYDGAVVSLAIDLQTGPEYDRPNWLTVFNQALYFNAAIDDESDNELMRFTPANGVSIIAQFPGEQSYHPRWITVLGYNQAAGVVSPNYGPKLFFSGVCCGIDPTDWSGHNTDHELFVYDGISTRMAANINTLPIGSAPYGSSSTPGVLTAWKDWLYFYAAEATHGRELWRVRPTTELNVYIAIGALFDRWWEWPIDWIDQPAVTAVYVVNPAGQRQLIHRNILAPGRLNPAFGGATIALRLDAARLPKSFALASLTFDERSGRRLSENIAVYGATTDSESKPLRDLAAARLRDLDLRRVRAERLVRGVAVERTQEQQLSPELQRAPVQRRQIAPVEKKRDLEKARPVERK